MAAPIPTVLAWGGDVITRADIAKLQADVDRREVDAVGRHQRALDRGRAAHADHPAHPQRHRHVEELRLLAGRRDRGQQAGGGRCAEDRRPACLEARLLTAYSLLLTA